MAFTDILGEYASNRWDQATQPFTDPEAYLRDRLRMDEEERKRKEREEAARREAEAAAAQQKAVDEAQAQQVQQPVQPEPGASVAQVPPGIASPNQYGSAIAQGATSEGPAPTQGGPAVPTQEVGNIEEQRRLQQVQAQQQAQPVAPEPQAATQPAVPQPFTGQGIQMPAAPAPTAQPAMSMEDRIAAAAQRAQERAGTGTQLPQFGPGVQVASTAPGAGVAEAAQAAQSGQMPAASVGSLQQVAQQQQAMAPARDHLDNVADIYNDPAKLMAYAKDEANPREGRLMAAKLLKQQVKTETEKQEAEDALRKAAETGDTTFLDRALRSKKEEGSILKAMLYARLGLNKLADDEQQKLGAGSKWQAVVGPNNERALIQYDAQGFPMSGMDANGRELSTKQLAMFGANAMPTKAHLLPSVHGGLMQKTVMDESGKPMTVTGVVVRDPRNPNNVYFEANGKRYDTSGLSTPAQNVQNVYGAAGAKAQGTAAGEGYKVSPLAPYPGAVGGGAGDNVEELKKALDRAQGDVAGSDRQLAELNRLPNTDPTKQQRIATIQAEKTKAQQQVQQLGGAIQGLSAGGGQVGAPAGATVAEQKKNLAIAEARAKEEIQVAGKRSEGFNKHIDETVTPEAVNGDTVSSLRKQQFRLFDRPGVDAGKIFGIANGAGQAPGDQRWTMFRDILLGKVSEPEDKIRERAAALGLNREEQSAVAEYAIANAEINAKTLKSTAGAGSVSDAEQAANRERNVDVTKIPVLGGYNAMAQSQFNGDLAKYKGDWAVDSKAVNTAQLEKEWRKEKQKLTDTYIDLAKKRIDYISSMGNTAAAVKEGYRRFPVPEYDAATGTWKKTKPISEILGR